MAVTFLGALPLGSINVAASGAVSLVVPMLAQVDLMLTGSFGLGSTLGDLALQLNAAIAAQTSLSLFVSNPLAQLEAQLAAILKIQASIAATIALGIPAVSLTLTASISASASISALLSLKVGGIQLLIEAALAVKIPLVSFVAELEGFLSAGPVVLLSIGYAGIDSLAGAGAQLAALFSTGVGGILPSDAVQGIVMITKDPSAGVALAGIIKTQ